MTLGCRTLIGEENNLFSLTSLMLFHLPLGSLFSWLCIDMVRLILYLVFYSIQEICDFLLLKTLAYGSMMKMFCI